MQPPIVVPLDGSAFGKRALPLALAMARRRGAGVELVHVHERPPTALGAPAFDPRFDSEQRALMRRELTALATNLQTETGVDATAHFLDGEVVGTLRQYIAVRSPSLVVMMTHGRGGRSHFWLGSVADGVIRGSTVPVLLLRAGAEWPGGLHEPLFRRMLVPLDDSDAAAEIIPHAMSLATPGATTLALLSVVDPGLALRPASVDLRPAAPVEPLVDSVRRVTADRLARLAGPLREAGLDVTTDVVVDPHPAQRVLAYAGEHEMDLIALATHARGALGRLLLGSVADKVIRGAVVPTLVSRPGALAAGSVERGADAGAGSAMGSA